LGALTRGIAAIVRPGAFRGRLERELRTLYPRTDPVPFASGRAALATAIILAMRATGRRVVVLPAYTSYSVAAAAAMAGARVRLCDLDPDTLDFDRDDLRDCVDDNVAAVVLGNLYGYPSAIGDLRWVRERGVLLIDDAAQALGALDFGEPVGGRADLGVLSFGRGKCVTTGDGGALLVHDADLHAHFSNNGQLPPSRGLQQMLYATAVKLSSSLTVFGMLSRLPGARIGESVFEPEFEIRSAPASVDGLASDLPSAVWQQREMRTAVAELWTASLRDSRTVRLVTPREQSQPSYLRFPVLTSDSHTRERLIERLARRGFTYVKSYPTTLGQIEAFRRGWCDGRSTPKAEWFAERVIALPCHARVSPRRVRWAVKALTDSTLPVAQSSGIANTLVSSKVS
jgi:dTDP-4-amino-4,6-dideoxygalactose transaminase